MENKFFGKYFSWPYVLVGLTQKWFEVKLFTSNHFWTHTHRERERERKREPRSLLRPSSSPTTTNWSRRSAPHQCRPTPAQIHTSTNQAKIDSNADQLQSPTTHTSTDRQSHRADQAKIDFNAARSRLRRAIWWIFFFWFCFFCVSIWPDLMNFFFSKFCFFCVSILSAEKMCATSRKCVFYGIFKNIIKHQKIFFKTFFKMQQNTWKYFPFPKIAFLENKYFPENILHESNTA